MTVKLLVRAVKKKYYKNCYFLLTFAPYIATSSGFDFDNNLTYIYDNFYIYLNAKKIPFFVKNL